MSHEDWSRKPLWQQYAESVDRKALEHLEANGLPVRPPEVSCLRDDVHVGHGWQSQSHDWWCPGRIVPLDRAAVTAAARLRHQRLAEQWDQGVRFVPGPRPTLWQRLAWLDRWAIGTAAVVGTVGGVLVGLWYR